MSNVERPLGPAAVFVHDHPPVRNVLAESETRMTLGQRVADRVAAGVGSWAFIITQSVLLLLWLAANVYLVVMASTHPGFLKAWDPYPFILLNLVLSFQAAYTGPVVMMSQNRQSEKDRLMAAHDYEINQKAEQEIGVIMEHLAHQDRLLLDAIDRLESMEVKPSLEQVAKRVDELLRRMEANDRRVIAMAERVGGAAPDAAGSGSP